MPNPTKGSVCLVCGANSDLDRGHVFPRVLFNDPKPKNMITIPECKQCNKKHQEWDIRLRDFLTAQCDPRHGGAGRLWHKTLRAASNNRSAVVRSLLDSGIGIDVVNEQGLWVGRTITGLVRADPIQLAVRELALRLTAWARGAFVPEVVVKSKFLDLQSATNQLRTMTSLGAANPTAMTDANGFRTEVRWTVMLDSDLPQSAVWLLLLYSQLGLVIVTDRAPSAETE